MIQRAPFQLPAGFLHNFGYHGLRRFVALYWQPSGDEACYDDGVYSTCGLCDNWLYLDLVRQPEVSGWLDENGINLGNSDESATHWLIVDAQTNDLYAALRREALQIVRRQRLNGSV